MCTAKRETTTTPLQALNLFNSRFVLAQSEVFAARFEAQVASDIEGNPEVAEYARRVTEETDEDDEPQIIQPPDRDELPDAEAMVDELERFLREQRNDPGSSTS
mgnify:CR=1 FL=1